MVLEKFVIKITVTFMVSLLVDPRLFESIPDGSDVRHPVVYFKVKKLRMSEKRSSSACLVDRLHSELLQVSFDFLLVFVIFLLIICFCIFSQVKENMKLTLCMISSVCLSCILVDH